MENPFRLGGSADGYCYVDRAEPIQRIGRALQESQGRLLILGPDRSGKTSAIDLAIAAARRKLGKAVRIDVAPASHLADVATRLLQAITAELGATWPDAMSTLIQSLSVGVSVLPEPATGSVRLTLDAVQRDAPAEEQVRILGEVLDAIESLAAGKRRVVGVALDEFQEIDRLGGKDAEAGLRAILRRHEHVSYLLAASDGGLIEEIGNRDRAFYDRFDILEFRPIDPPRLAEWIAERIASGGLEADAEAASAIVAIAGARAGDAVQLAQASVEAGRARGRVGTEEVGAGFLTIIAAAEPYIRSQWQSLTALQQNVLRAIAAGERQLTGKRARRRFALGGSSSVLAALDGIVRRKLIRSTSGGYSFDSPFVRGWVIVNALIDIGIRLDPLSGALGGAPSPAQAMS